MKLLWRRYFSSYFHVRAHLRFQFAFYARRNNLLILSEETQTVCFVAMMVLLPAMHTLNNLCSFTFQGSKSKVSSRENIRNSVQPLGEKENGFYLVVCACVCIECVKSVRVLGGMAGSVSWHTMKGMSLICCQFPLPVYIRNGEESSKESIACSFCQGRYLSLSGDINHYFSLA